MVFIQAWILLNFDEYFSLVQKVADVPHHTRYNKYRGDGNCFGANPAKKPVCNWPGKIH
jgi:hypothetical protein